MKQQPAREVDASVASLAAESINLSSVEVGARIKTARKTVGLTQEKLAGLAGATSNRGIQDNEAGKSIPGGQMIWALIRAGINANWLLTGEGPMLQAELQEKKTAVTEQQEPTPGYVAIPLFNDVRAAAGAGALNGLLEKPDDALMFKADWIRFELGARPEDLNLIRVSGDSMEPTLRAGDVVLIDHRAQRPDREGIYILRLGEMLLVKRLQALPGGLVRVVSDNPAFAPWEISLEKIGSDMAILGRVVWSGRRH